MSNNMSISSIKEHYNNLCTKAKEWSAAYYEQDAPVVTDEEYDSVMHEIRDIGRIVRPIAAVVASEQALRTERVNRQPEWVVGLRLTGRRRIGTGSPMSSV